MGKILTYKGLMKRDGKPDIRVYRCMECPYCERKAECTKAEYRAISLDPREYLFQKMRAKLETREGKIRYRKRKYLVEPVFGDIKYNRNMRMLLLRGKLKAKGEFLIMCIVHNLKKDSKVFIWKEEWSRVMPYRSTGRNILTFLFTGELNYL